MGSGLLEDCVFRRNQSGGGGGVFAYDVVVQGCLFEGNVGDEGGALQSYGDATIEHCTFAGNRSSLSAIIDVAFGATEIRNTIVCFSDSGVAATCSASGTITASCCDFFGNAGGDWVGCVAGQENINGNLSADPLFCDLAAGDYTLNANSPCAPPQSGDCGQIGAFGVGCGAVGAESNVESRSWGQIKSLFR
jgi:hypothetical protein